MSSEVRVIRPFNAAAQTQALLDASSILEIRCDGTVFEVSPGQSSRSLDSRFLLRASYVLKLPPNLAQTVREECETDLGIPARNLGLAVVAQSKYLKRTEVLKIIEVDQIPDSQEIEIKSEIRRCVHTGWNLSISLIVIEELAPEVGKASSVGNWLAKINFAILTPKEGLGFTPLPLTPQVRVQHRLGDETSRFILIKDGMSVLESSSVDDLLEYYVDETILTRLSASPNSAASKLEQVRIFLDAASFIVSEAMRLPQFSVVQLTDIGGTIIDKFLVFLAGDDDDDKGKWLVAWQQSPSRFLAGLEDACNLKNRIETVLDETI